MIRLGSRLAAVLAGVLLFLAGASCGDGGHRDGEGRVLRLAAGGRIVSLDPIYASDVASQRLCAALFDTLLEYDYPRLPYRLRPGLLAEMPEFSPDGLELRCVLRDDLFFPAAGVLASEGREARRVTSRDVIYSILRIADGRNHSPNYSLIRGRIVGLEEFRENSGTLPAGDDSIYDCEHPGIRAVGEREFVIRLARPDRRFLYILAIPSFGIVSRAAAEKGAEQPLGSGPFKLEKWIREYSITMVRNPEFRRQYFPEAETPADRARPLPLCDRIECFCIRQNQAAWLLFLQGGLDAAPLARENADVIAPSPESGAMICVPALAGRGIVPVRSPGLEIQYIGFNMNHPVLGRNVKLRRAMSMACNRERLSSFFSGLIQPASSPLPPGVPESPDFASPWARTEPEAARRLMAEAGFPEGIDPATGENLCFDLDLNGNSSLHRQIGEMLASDMAVLGIRLNPVLNNSPRFFQKVSSGQTELFRLSWQGDYPDCENFLQLFSSRLLGGANRTGYSNAGFDRIFDDYLTMEDAGEREAAIREMVEIISDDCPWIFESIPVAYTLKHAWLENMHPHEFAFGAWKYLSVNPEARERARENFTPIDNADLTRR